MQSPHAKLLWQHLEAENAHNLEGTLATLHPDCVFQDHATGQVWNGREGAAAHYRQWWDCFDVEVVRKEGQSAGWIGESVYAAEATWIGTHSGEFLGTPATGKAISQPFVVLVAFKDGLMSEERFHYDLGSLLRQIGVDPVPALAKLPYRK
jgi:steroid delta-isomerase-like uncharacterized protein